MKMKKGSVAVGCLVVILAAVFGLIVLGFVSTIRFFEIRQEKAAATQQTQQAKADALHAHVEVTFKDDVFKVFPGYTSFEQDKTGLFGPDQVMYRITSPLGHHDVIVAASAIKMIQVVIEDPPK